MTDCSNILQDFGPIKIQFWWSRVPLFLWCRRQASYHFPTKFKPRLSAKDRRVDQCIRIAEVPCFGWNKWPCAQSVRIMLFLCRLYRWTENKFMIRKHFMAVVPGLIVSDVNFNFSCFIHNHRFCKSGVLMFLHHRKTPRSLWRC